MNEPEVPLLVVDVPFRRPWWMRQWIVCVAVAVGVAAFAILARERALPWVPDAVGRALASKWKRRLLLVVVGAAAFTAYHLWTGRLRRRAGRFELHRDRVVVVRPRVDDPDEAANADVPWSDLRGFRDEAEDHVLLVPREGARVALELALPTPTEADRVRLLALLDARGLPRLDA